MRDPRQNHPGLSSTRQSPRLFYVESCEKSWSTQTKNALAMLSLLIQQIIFTTVISYSKANNRTGLVVVATFLQRSVRRFLLL
jgi:hypothetical protein